jgi:protein-S-isoprenylcysteine O-methyltransferase Ste14
MTFGICFSLYALFVLGKNFSIIPQARSLVQRGPYKLIRHPLYTAEILSTFGIFLVRPSVLTTVLFLLIILGQVYRAFQEEILLNSTFPEYENYRLKTARFIPHIF